MSADTKILVPSESWDAYVEVITTFRGDLDTRLNEGEHLCAELFSRTLDLENSQAKVTTWLAVVDDALAPVSRYRDVLRGAALPGEPVGHL